MKLQNKASKLFFLLFLTISSIISLNGQSCIIYNDIEGNPCQDCAPNGWIPSQLFLTGPHIIIPENGPLPNSSCELFNISGPSPVGGNVQLLRGDVDWEDFMTIETTISGLNTSVTHAFVMYWEGITITCSTGVTYSLGKLQITIDGLLYEFTGATEWEKAEVCFTPSSSTIDIVISTTPSYPNEESIIIIDGNYDCLEESICCLSPIIGAHNYYTCHEETIVLDADYESNLGPVQVSWSCDPPEGLNYLSATNVVSPEFTFPVPTPNFSGEIYKFIMTIQDDNCTQVSEPIEVEVLPSIISTFDIELCALDSIAILPLESENGYTGTWSGNFNIEFEGGNIVSLLFTVDAGQNNCIDSYEYDFLVNSGYTPTFNVEEVYCLSDSTDYILPNESEEGNIGQWFPNNMFNPYSLGEGSYLYVFELYDLADINFCVSTYELNLYVTPNNPASFDLPEQYCFDTSYYVLPQISVEGVSGSWTLDSIDLSISVQDSQLVFIPDSSYYCSMDFNYVYSVFEYTTPVFTIEDFYCKNDAIFNLPEISNDSIQGNWNINIVDPSLQDSLIIIFSPDTVGCHYVFSQTLYFIEYLDPFFELPTVMCKEDDIITFPNLSENGINGTWTVSTFDPSMTTQNTFSNTFTPNDTTCTSNFTITIEIFSFENISIEGIDPTSCESEDGSIHITGASSDMEQSTDDGITWTTVTNVENLPSGLYNIELRFQALPSCSILHSLQINNSESPIIQELISNAPSSCNQEDGTIECIVIGNGLEYSIDNISWQTSNIFENLAIGNYMVYVRFVSLIDCVSSTSTEIENIITMEICDGLDNNCDGEIDENLPVTAYFADTDMDGYGDPNVYIISCIQPQDYIIDSTDCDDNNPNVNPAAVEIYNNGIDEDCNGVDLTTSVRELAGQKVNIYPNPTNGLVTIEMGGNLSISISLFDIHGKCLIRKVQLDNVDLSEYSNGIYLMKITNLDSFESIVERVILNK